MPSSERGPPCWPPTGPRVFHRRFHQISLQGGGCRGREGLERQGERGPQETRPQLEKVPRQLQGMGRNFLFRKYRDHLLKPNKGTELAGFLLEPGHVVIEGCHLMWVGLGRRCWKAGDRATTALCFSLALSGTHSWKPAGTGQPHEGVSARTPAGHSSPTSRGPPTCWSGDEAFPLCPSKFWTHGVRERNERAG